jgi:anti-sigma-K factor RskA
MRPADHERYAGEIGAYLLGSLPELEARVFERHLMGCDQCRDEIEHLRPAADALPRAVAPFAPPPSLKRALMEVVEADARERSPARAARPPRRRLAFPALPSVRPGLAWAAVALVVAGAALGLGIDRATRGGSSERVVAARVDRSALPHGNARLVVHGTSHATLSVAGLPVLGGGRVYEVWIEHGGSLRPAGALFAVSSDGRGAAAIPSAVRKGDRVLVTRERAGGVAQPSEAPVISARA